MSVIPVLIDHDKRVTRGQRGSKFVAAKENING